MERVGERKSRAGAVSGLEAENKSSARPPASGRWRGLGGGGVTAALCEANEGRARSSELHVLHRRRLGWPSHKHMFAQTVKPVVDRCCLRVSRTKLIKHADK